MVTKKVEIKNHVLLLKHEKMNEKDSDDLLKKYNISRSQLPFILKKDPVLIGFEDIKSGDIIKISRMSPTAGKIEYFRVVIHG